MEKIVIDGGNALHGHIKISGMKNAADPILFACAAVNGICVIDNLPSIGDVDIALSILSDIGAKVRRLNETSVEIDASGVVCAPPSLELYGKIRSSYYLLGSLLGRFGQAQVGLPGGCDLGARPIDQHIKAFEMLGAVVYTDEKQISAKAENKLTGAHIYFDCVTVGGTINAMIAASLAEGLTVIENAAREPHVVDVANFLNFCGAGITGAGTGTIKIRGVKELHGCTYTIIPDNIEAGTFMMAAAATRGRLYIDGIIPRHVEAITAKLIEMGVSVEEYDDAVLVSHKGALHSVNIKTLPYPGFPTDMNPQIAVLLSLADGTGKISETIFENRFRYVEELRRMGAQITTDGKTATFTGKPYLIGANVRAVDLRAGVAMVIAGLAADGCTVIDDIYHIERGYDHIVEKFKSCGARIRRITDQSSLEFYR